MNSTWHPKYWRSIHNLSGEHRASCRNEFPPGASEWSNPVTRRQFIELAGGSLALAGFASCTRQPRQKIVPFVHQPEGMTPGEPLFFATAMPFDGFGIGLLAKSREGRPIKVEGNPQHPASLGGSSAFAQASILSLYDPDRSQAVIHGGQISNWSSFQLALYEASIAQERKHGAGLRLLSETITSPTLAAQLRAVLKKFPEARWHQFQPVCRDAAREGAKLAFGEFVEAHLKLDRAAVIVSFESDFLFAHPDALRYAREFTTGRRRTGPDEAMSRLYVLESTPSITGSMADHRLTIASSEIEQFAGLLARKLGIPGAGNVGIGPTAWQRFINTLAQELNANHGRSLLVAGEQQPAAVHALVHRMNDQLGNRGKTVVYTASAEANPVNQTNDLAELSEEMERGAVEVLLIVGGNPGLTAPADFEFAARLERVPLRVHLDIERNETADRCHWHLPGLHYLESWSDIRAFDGTVSLIQPLIEPIHGGHSPHELLDMLLHPPPRLAYDVVREFWKEQNLWPDFERGWRRALHAGFIEGTALAPKNVTPRFSKGAEPLTASAPEQPQARSLEVVFRPDPSAWDGLYANNAWLQELPKPIQKLTWDNAVFVSPALAARERLRNGDVIEIDFAKRSIQAPVWIVPGQAENSLTLTLGYGRRGKTAAGYNAYPIRVSNALWFARGALLQKTGKKYQLVSTQDHHELQSDERQIVREIDWRTLQKNPGALRATVEAPPPSETLFNPDEHPYHLNKWGMAIDLTACIGCNACVAACQAENNIPVVGKHEVANGREMHWIRIDSYFRGPPENPAITHAPVPCMHCENAPCEVVCPVEATVHDREGLNLQVYNRCIGTRYCSNNCPWKVRRFNFLQYANYQKKEMEPVWNPEVTVRWRGVMEKCTFCIQRLSAARISAKKENRPVRENEIVPACAQACPADAIVLGDLNQREHRVNRLKASPLNYSMLGQLNTRPRTTYLARLRNPHPALTVA